MVQLNGIKFWIVCSLVILTTLAYGTVHQPTITVFYLLTAVLTLVWATECILSGEIKISRTMLQLPLFFLALFCLIQIIPFASGDSAGTLSIDPFSTQLTAFHLLFLSLFFVTALTSIDSAKRLQRIVTVIIIFGFAYSFYAILQSVLSPDRIYGIYQPQSGRPFGSFVNKHDYAAIIEMIVCLPLGLLFTGAVPSDKKLLYVVIVGLMLTSLLLSGSRGGLVAFLSGLLFLVILSSRAKGSRHTLIRATFSFLLVVIAVGGAIFVGGETSLTRFGEAGENITSNRTEIWAGTIEVIREYFPLGAGLGAFGQAYTRFDPGIGTLRVEQAHNDYLQVLADAGMVGGILGLAFLFWLIKEGRRSLGSTIHHRRGVALGALAGVFAVLIHSLFDFVLHITAVSVTFLMMLSILVAAGREFGEQGNMVLGRKRRSADVTPIDLSA